MSVPVAAPAPGDDGFVHLEVELGCLHPHPNNRSHREADIEAMAASIQAMGQQVEGIGCVDPTLPSGHYRILDAHLRYHAARRAGLTRLRMKILKHACTPAEAAEVMVTTGAVRASMRPSQVGEHYRTILSERKIDQATLAQRLGVSPSKVSNALLLKNGHPALQHAVDFEGFPSTAATELIRKARSPDRQAEVLKELRDLGLDRNRDAAIRHIQKVTAAARPCPAPKPATVGTRVERTRKAMEAAREWGRSLVAEIDRLLKLNITEAAMADTLIEKFGLKGR